MLEITPEDIASLDDKTLRTLVGYLCEAELRKLGLPTSAVTWGGPQEAPDGGIDVRVSLPLGSSIEGFVPRPSTGFQVKKSDLGPAAIFREMRPSGTLRPSIEALAHQSGAYVIVSSGANVADPVLNQRRAKMSEAASAAGGENALLLDYYDRSRVATWVRTHPGLIPWVRKQAGRALSGWRSYEAWAYSPRGAEDTYLLDAKLRLQAGNRDGNGISALDGIGRLRTALRQSRSVVRLAGLSGVGKTRLVQALFDGRIGEDHLDPALAIYTDIADNPDPQPTGMASDLIAVGARAVLIVDNCPRDLHRRLTEVCRGPDSTVSVITVEYDIRDDEPEGTEAFRLEPSSAELIEELLKQRIPEISRVDAKRAAEFSGGNARMALALVRTLEGDDSLANLSDDDLFRRLFFQRHAPDPQLLHSAEASALVYSFEGEAIDGDKAELPRIAAIAGVDAPRLYRHIAELKRRDLVQQRGVWRAVLPHGIANRLAKMALQDFPTALIEQQLVHQPSERLLKSFSRRLGYLHDSAEARSLVSRWLGVGGLLGDVASLNQLGMAMFEYVAPVVPEATLAAIERAIDGDAGVKFLQSEGHRSQIAKVLRSIAYEAELFDRSAQMLAALAKSDAGQGNRQRVPELFRSLFFIVFSGTLASVEQRTKAIGALLQSDDPAMQRLGLDALGAALQTDSFGSVHSFEFGARRRNYGLWHRTPDEIGRWFSTVAALMARHVDSDSAVGDAVRRELAKNFRFLWYRVRGVRDQLESLISNIADKRDWQDGWIAINRTLVLHAKKSDELEGTRLRAIAERLRPTNLAQQIRAVVLTEAWGPLDYAGIKEGEEDNERDILASRKRANLLAEDLGKQLADDCTTFAAMAPELVRSGSRLHQLGRGLALATNEPKATWNTLTTEFATAREGGRNSGALCGFLNGLHEINPVLASALLDDAVRHDALQEWFPILATSVVIDDRGMKRLEESLAHGRAHISMYRYLAGGRAIDSASGPDLARFLSKLADRPDGSAVALDILSMRFHSDRDEKRDHPAELLDAGRSLLENVAFNAADQMHDYRLRMIIAPCLRGSHGRLVAMKTVKRYKAAVKAHETYAFNHDQFLEGMFSVQPQVTLDSLFDGDQESQEEGVAIFDHFDDERKIPIDIVPAGEVVAWCDRDPTIRYPLMARVVRYFAGGDGRLEWSPLALRMLEEAPDPIIVLRQFIDRFRPMSWSGSRAAIMEARLQLLDQLPASLSLGGVVGQEKPGLIADVVKERRRETEYDRATDGQFE